MGRNSSGTAGGRRTESRRSASSTAADYGVRHTLTIRTSSSSAAATPAQTTAAKQALRAIGGRDSVTDAMVKSTVETMNARGYSARQAVVYNGRMYQVNNIAKRLRRENPSWSERKVMSRARAEEKRNAAGRSILSEVARAG